MTDNCADQATCTNNIGTEPSYTCTCNPGFVGNGTKTDTYEGCEDIDECKTNKTICSDETCINTDGSYVCVQASCSKGSVKNEEGSCVNRNECEDGSHDCGFGTICTDKTPEENFFICECPDADGWSYTRDEDMKKCFKGL